MPLSSRVVEAHQVYQLAGGRWLHASAYLILEDVRLSLVACVRLQTYFSSF